MNAEGFQKREAAVGHWALLGGSKGCWVRRALGDQLHGRRCRGKTPTRASGLSETWMGVGPLSPSGARGILREESSPAAPPCPRHLTTTPPQLIYMYWMNTVVNYCGPFEYEVGYCERLKNFLEANLEWMQKEMELNNGSAYWHQVGAAPCSEGWGGRLGQLQDLLPLQLPLFHWPTCLPLLSASSCLPPSIPHPPTHPSTYPSASPVHSHISPIFLPPCPPFPFCFLHIRLSNPPPTHLSIHPPTPRLSIHPPTPISPSTPPPTHPSLHPHHPPSHPLPTHPSFHLSICLRIHASGLSAQLICPPSTSLSIFHFLFIRHLSARLSPVVKIFCPPTLLLYPVCYLSRFIICLSVHLPSLLPV